MSKIDPYLASLQSWGLADAEKHPLTLSGQPAARGDSNSTRTHSIQQAWAAKGETHHLAFQLLSEHNLLVVDLDPKEEVVDPATGKGTGKFVRISSPEFVAQAMAQADTYAEVSASGDGIHYWYSVPQGFQLPNRAGKQSFSFEAVLPSGKKYLQHVDLMHYGSYVVVPLKRQEGVIQPLSASAQQLIDACAHKGNVRTQREQWEDVREPDEDVLERARNGSRADKFRSLWAGEWGGYPSRSEADLALMNLLSTYTSNNAQLVRLFHASELGQRPKNHRKDIVERLLRECRPTSKPSNNHEQPMVTFSLPDIRIPAPPPKIAELPPVKPVKTQDASPIAVPPTVAAKPLQTTRADCGLSETMLGQLAKNAARALEFPEHSLFITLLGAASCAVSCVYRVRYDYEEANSGSEPLGLFVAVEQPPGTSKSRVYNLAMDPYIEALDSYNRQIPLAKPTDLDARRKVFVAASDSTTAGLEKLLSSRHDGRFVLASDEQGLVNSLFPKNGAFLSNNDIILKGYNGGNAVSIRTSRDTYSGPVYGSILLIAQPGAVNKITSANSGTGLAERFFFASEESMLGKRTHTTPKLTSAELHPYQTAIRYILVAYANRLEDEKHSQHWKEVLACLYPSPAAEKMIFNKKVSLEPQLAELSRAGQFTATGWLSKMPTHVLKVASILHVTEYAAKSQRCPLQIDDCFISMAVALFDKLAVDFVESLTSSVIEDTTKEELVIIKALEDGPMVSRELCRLLGRRAPFRNSKDPSPYALARQHVEALVENGRLAYTDPNNDKSPIYVND